MHVLCKCSKKVTFNLSPSFMLPIDGLLFHFRMFHNMISFFLSFFLSFFFLFFFLIFNYYFLKKQ